MKKVLYSNKLKKKLSITPLFKVGDIVHITKNGLGGSTTVPWSFNGSMDRFDGKTAMISRIDVIDYSYFAYCLEGIDGIEFWTFGEDNLSLHTKDKEDWRYNTDTVYNALKHIFED